MTTRKGRIEVPEFATEAQEAAWWDNHKSEVEENLSGAIQAGAAQRGSAQRLVREARLSKNITSRMPLDDIERARELSARKGLVYQTLMKMLLHEALEKEHQRLAG